MVQEVNIGTHIVAGVLALLMGLVSYMSIKGGTLHRRSGKAFVFFMGLVITTAAIGVFFFRDRPFLTLITIQSTYLTISGLRALTYKERGPGWIDGVIVATLLSATGVFVWNLAQSTIVWPRSIVYYTLAFIAAESCYDILRITKVFDWKQAWLPEHFLKMTGAYSALLSAGSGTVLVHLGPAAQIISANLGGLLFIAVILVYRRTLRGGRAALPLKRRAYAEDNAL